MKKEVRQRILKQLILEHTIGTQEELIQLLEASGVHATQATISRDIRELSIIKQHLENGQVKYALFSQEGGHSIQTKLENSLKDSLIRLECIQFMVIVHTDANSADVITNYLDEVGYEEIAGTIAGIDTIFIIAYTHEQALSLVTRIEAMISSNK